MTRGGHEAVEELDLAELVDAIGLRLMQMPPHGRLGAIVLTRNSVLAMLQMVEAGEVNGGP